MIAARDIFQFTLGQYTLSNTIYLKPKFALQDISIKLNRVIRFDRLLKLVKNIEEVAILFGVSLSIVLKIVLNYKLAKISSSLRRLVVVELDSEI